tara:strand:+ start:534 stop:668 length:135 start_codon:yes stop_codon:yes gene_type:complete
MSAKTSAVKVILPSKKMKGDLSGGPERRANYNGNLLNVVYNYIL